MRETRPSAHTTHMFWLSCFLSCVIILLIPEASFSRLLSTAWPSCVTSRQQEMLPCPSTLSPRTLGQVSRTREHLGGGRKLHPGTRPPGCAPGCSIVFGEEDVCFPNWQEGATGKFPCSVCIMILLFTNRMTVFCLPSSKP